MSISPGPAWLFYGGTFDPVHNGHLAVAREAADALGSVVRLMPAADPPHRAPPGASAAQRARMLDLAVADDPRMVVDRRELARAEPSWTVDTLRALRAELGDSAPVALLVGADSLRDLPQWKQWRDLLDLAHFVVAERAGSSLDGALSPELEQALAGRWTSEAGDLEAVPAGRVLRLRQPLQAESATDLRARIASGRPWQHLLPAAVAAYITGQGLYGATAGPDSGCV